MSEGAPAKAVRLRPMRWWDVERLMPTERALFGDTAWTAESFWSELAHPQTRWYLVAEAGADDTLLGYAGLMVSASECDVQTVAVTRTAQGSGVGRLLLQALVAEAVRRGTTSVLLEVRADNDAAIGLYRRHGFDQIGLRRRYYQPGDVDALVMRLRPVPGQVPGQVPGLDQDAHP